MNSRPQWKVGDVIYSTQSPHLQYKIVKVRKRGYDWVYAERPDEQHPHMSENSCDPLFEVDWALKTDTAPSALEVHNSIWVLCVEDMHRIVARSKSREEALAELKSRLDNGRKVFKASVEERERREGSGA